MHFPKFLHVYELEGPAPSGFRHPDLLGIWKEGEYSFVFFGREDQVPLNIKLTGIRSYHIFRYEEWIGGSLNQLKIGKFLITPVWQAKPPYGPYELILDPNVVFGSGQHPTTIQCLTIISDYKFTAKTAIDLGTGTGILALALGKLGVKVNAIDNNPLCVEVAKKNVTINGLMDLVRVELGDARKESLSFYDFILANLGPDLIFEIIEKLNPKWNKFLLLSGITRSFVGGILNAVKTKGYSLIIHLDDGTWHTLFVKGEAHVRKNLPS